MEYFTFGAEQEDVGTRIDVFLADAMENLSRSGVQKLIEEDFPGRTYHAERRKDKSKL